MEPPANLPDHVSKIFRRQPEFLRMSKVYRAYVTLYCAGKIKLPPYEQIDGGAQIWSGELWCRHKGCPHTLITKAAETRNVRKHAGKYHIEVRAEGGGQIPIAARANIISFYSRLISQPSKMTYTVAPHLKYFAVPLASFMAARPEMEGFGVGAYIFYRADDPPRVLLLQRAESDSMPGCWEGPGGACESGKDATLLDSLVRETLEESGLHVSRIVELVAVDCWEHQRRSGGKIRIAKYSFIVDVYENFQPDTREPVSTARIPIQLDPAEHQHYDWVAEHSARISANSSSGPYKFPPLGHQAPNILRAFELLTR